MAELKDIRDQLDVLDNEFIRMFLKRMSLSEEVARIKIRDGIPVLNAVREQEIITRLTEGMDDETAGYVKELYLKIFELSRQRQKILMEENKKSD